MIGGIIYIIAGLSLIIGSCIILAIPTQAIIGMLMVIIPLISAIVYMSFNSDDDHNFPGT